jgi:hypothetical protein
MKNVVDNNPFLQVSSGVLTIRRRGQLLSSLIADARNFDEEFVPKFSSRAATDENFDRRTVLDFDFKVACENPPFDPARHIKALLIAQWAIVFRPSINRGGSSSGDSTPGEDESVWTGKTIYVLILEPTEKENGYRRIGVAEIPEEKIKVEKWDLETVTIV